MKIPYATIFLTVLIASAYFYLSNFALYSTEKDLLDLSYHISKNPILVVVYMFVHTGLYHLFGNITPLIFFSFILERKIGSKNTFSIFILSGISSAILFSIFEPKYALLGASAAVAGIMGAATTRSPKLSFPTLILTPILIYYLIFPTISFATISVQDKLAVAENKLMYDINTAIEKGEHDRVIELNQSLKLVVEEKQKIEEGKQLEIETPTSISIHLFGAIFGVIYLYILNKEEFANGLKEYANLTSRI